MSTIDGMDAKTTLRVGCALAGEGRQVLTVGVGEQTAGLVPGDLVQVTDGTRTRWAILDTRDEDHVSVVTLRNSARAARSELEQHSQALHGLAVASELTNLRLLDDGTLLVHTPGRGYKQVATFITLASGLVGAYVATYTDRAAGPEQDGEPW